MSTGMAVDQVQLRPASTCSSLRACLVVFFFRFAAGVRFYILTRVVSGQVGVLVGVTGYPTPCLYCILCVFVKLHVQLFHWTGGIGKCLQLWVQVQPFPPTFDMLRYL